MLSLSRLCPEGFWSFPFSGVGFLLVGGILAQFVSGAVQVGVFQLRRRKVTG